MDQMEDDQSAVLMQFLLFKIRAQCLVKLADQIVFWLNQLMGFSFALFSS